MLVDAGTRRRAGEPPRRITWGGRASIGEDDRESVPRRRWRDGTLSNAEKAGVLGMVGIVVIILGLVITAGESSDAVALNPESTASKVKRALDQKDVPKSVVSVTQPALVTSPDPARVKEADAAMGGRPWPKALQGATAPANAPDAKKAGAAASGYRTYVIRKGDMLGSIARRELGRSSRWKEITRLNPKLDPKKLMPGEEIRLPLK